MLFDKNLTILIQIPEARSGGYTIPSGVTSIGDSVFAYCNLTSVTIPSSVASISSTAFLGGVQLISIMVDPGNPTYASRDGMLFDKNLTTLFQCPRGITGSYSIPNGVTNIGDYAFYSCPWLTNVTIPASATVLGAKAFAACDNLSITVDSSNPAYASLNGALFDKSLATLIQCPAGITGSYSIPNSVTNIGDYAFYFCTGLSNVAIPSSVTSIGYDAFFGCTKLKSALFAGNAPTIGQNVFSFTASGFTVQYFSGATGFTSPVWNGYLSLRVPLAITGGATSVSATSAMLTGTINPGGLSTTYYFQYGLTGTYGTTTIVQSAGSGTKSISGSTAISGLTPSITYHYQIAAVISGGTTYGLDQTFTTASPFLTATNNNQISITGYSGTAATLVIPSTINDLPVTSIGTKAFYNCKSFTSVQIPNSITLIGDSAFYSCSNLTNVTIPGSVTSIGGAAFASCTGLTSVAIPDSVTSIGSTAFGRCTGLTSVAIPDSVTSIGDDVFYGCTGLTSVSIPNSVTSIGVYAFGGCSGLTSVTIPNSVTSIGGNAFFGCNGLTSVTIPGSATTIGNQAFSYCSQLGSITVDPANPAYASLDGVLFDKTLATLIQFPGGLGGSYTVPSSVTSIGTYAFYKCSGLTSVTIPSSVTSIRDYAFYSCSGLTSVTIPSSVTSIGNYTFSSCSGLTRVTIPNSVTTIGNNAFSSCSGLTSVTIPNSVTSIGYYAFSSCSGLTSVTVPSSVTSIGGYAFWNCSGLASVTIPNSVTNIGEYAFSGCSGLTSVMIPNSVTSIGNGAFYYCAGLKFARFAGNAPTMGTSVFDSTASGFTVNYFNGAAGFTSPTWNGYTATNIGTPSPVFTSGSLSSGTAGMAYNQTLTASGGIPPYTWSIVSGSLPSGLSLDSSGGVISGTADAAAIANFTLQVADSNSMSSTTDLRLTITPADSVGVPALPPWAHVVLLTLMTLMVRRRLPKNLSA